MPTVVGNVFGSQRVSVATGMIVTGWGGGYLMVCVSQISKVGVVPYDDGRLIAANNRALLSLAIFLAPTEVQAKH